MRKLFKILAFVLSLSLAFEIPSFAKGATSNTQGSNTQATKTITINCYGASEIPLPWDLDVKTIEGISVQNKTTFIPVSTEIKNDILVITPIDNFEYKTNYSIKIFTGIKKYVITAKAMNYQVEKTYDGTIIKVPPKRGSGFNYPYFLYLPDNIDMNKTETKRLIVEPNNTGSVTDILGYHQEAAHMAVNANGNPPHKVAYEMGYPFLLPVFPRPYTNFWESYTHALDKGAMLLTGDMKRLDLQLIAMIKDSKKVLSSMGYKLQDKVFMTGYSASGQFTNRFATLHPEIVKAIAVGNFTMYPVDKLNGVTLNYPWGINDIKKLFGITFNKKEYSKIAQYCYIGDLDDHDQPYNDYGFDSAELKAVNDLFGYDNALPKWDRKWNFIKQIGYDKNIQFNVYKGVGHGYCDNSNADVVEFFKANDGEKIVKIKPHSTANGVD